MGVAQISMRPWDLKVVKYNGSMLSNSICNIFIRICVVFIIIIWIAKY